MHGHLQDITKADFLLTEASQVSNRRFWISAEAAGTARGSAHPNLKQGRPRWSHDLRGALGTWAVKVLPRGTHSAGFVVHLEDLAVIRVHLGVATSVYFTELYQRAGKNWPFVSGRDLLGVIW